MSEFNFDIIVVRETMLAESYGAYLWNKHRGCEVGFTPSITELHELMLEEIKDKSILIVGGYYQSNMDPIIKVAKEITVFYNSSDITQDVVSNYKCIRANEFTGFLTWTTKILNIEDDHILMISQYLDEYIYGYPSNDALCFQNGISVIDKDNNWDKMSTITSMEDIRQIVIKGKENTITNKRIAYQRFGSSEEITFNIGDKSYSACVSIGDCPIVDTCLLLADQSSDGIGMLFRYDMKARKTFISTRSTQESNINAGLLMKQLIGGGGSKSMGGGSISGLLFPEQVLSQ